MIQDTATVLKEQFEKRINSFLKGSVDISINSFGSKFKLPHPNKIATWKKGKEAKIPNMLSFNNGLSEDPVCEQITDKNFGRWFDTERFKFEDLLIEFEALRKNLSKANSEKMNKQSEATMALASIGEDEVKIQYKTKDYHFFSTIDCGTKYTVADDEFIFNNLYKDEGNNLYWKLKDKLYLLNFKTNGERELVGNTNDADSQFWPDFFRIYEDKFDEWNRKITTIVQAYDWNEANESIEKTLLNNGIPRIWLECLLMKVRMKGLEQEIGNTGKKEIVWYNEGATVALNGANGRQEYTKRNLIEILSKTLMVAVDVNRLKTIPTYSNNRNEVAIKYLDMPKCSDPKAEPKLPPMWEKFLGGNRFYSPYMDKMKIATFVCNVLNARYSGRQVLCLGGTGEDGKGVFLHILDMILGTEHTANVPFGAFSDSDQFGLASVINKKFVYLSDCKFLSKLFSSDKFKQLTGHDKISINRKNMDFFSYVPKGTVFAAVTNNSFYVNDTHGKSRVMPVVFRKNFDTKNIIDKNEMEEKLYAEKDAFLQWCVDYRYWLNALCNGNLLRGTQLIMCCDRDLEKVKNGEIDDNKLFKSMCETETLNGKPFCNWNDYEETDDDTDVYNPLFESCFTKTDNDTDYITVADMIGVLEKYITKHNEYLDCFDTYKTMDESRDVVYRIKYIGNNQKWRHWCDFLTAKMELVKRHNLAENGKNCWFKVKIRQDADIEKPNYANEFMGKLTKTTDEKINEAVTGDSPFTQYVKKGNELHERYERGEISLENESEDTDDFFKRLEEQN